MGNHVISRVVNSETVVLGGHIADRRRSGENRVPSLSGNPLIGDPFKIADRARDNPAAVRHLTVWTCRGLMPFL